MVFTIGDSAYKTEDINYINTAYKIMGFYVIEIHFNSQKNPLVLEYTNKSEYDSKVRYLKNRLSIGT